MELLVWYGDCYLQFMGVPVALKEMADGGVAEEADSKYHNNCIYPKYLDTLTPYQTCPKFEQVQLDFSGSNIFGKLFETWVIWATEG